MFQSSLFIRWDLACGRPQITPPTGVIKNFYKISLCVLNFPPSQPLAAEMTRKPQRHSFCRITAKCTVGPQYQLIIACNSISPSRFVNTKLNQVFNISKLLQKKIALPARIRHPNTPTTQKNPAPHGAGFILYTRYQAVTPRREYPY